MSVLSFSGLIKRVAPEALSGYLKNAGWFEDGRVGSHAIIWHRRLEQNYDSEVIQPVDSSIRGYVQRMKEALEALAEYEKREVFQVARDIVDYYSDIVSVRVVHFDVDAGTIPLDDGVLLVEKSRDLVVASTLATFNKQRFYRGSRPQDAQDFIRQLKLGQTEAGSFIVNIISPVTSLVNNQVDNESVSLSRAVSINLSRSLTAIAESIERFSRTNSVFEFEGVVAKGVSANLCDALVGLSGSGKNREFHVYIKTAGVEVDTQGLVGCHSFFPEKIQFLERASEYLKGKYSISNYCVLGLVSGVKHLPDDEFGQIFVKASVNESDKIISFQVDMASYWDAVHAHESGSLVSCVGDLHVSPRSALLLDPRDFKVVGGHRDLFEE